LTSARSQVKALLTEHLDQLHALAGALLEHETLNATQIKVSSSSSSSSSSWGGVQAGLWGDAGSNKLGLFGMCWSGLR
jgi:hypothetical protein